MAPGDFTTESDANVTGDMLEVRRLAMEAMEATPPVVTVTEVQDDVDTNVARRIRGTLRVPLFLESDQPGALLARDEAGNVRRNGEAEVPFTLQIPRSVWGQGGAPARFVQYGHGFFGRQAEADGSFVRPFIQATPSCRSSRTAGCASTTRSRRTSTASARGTSWGHVRGAVAARLARGVQRGRRGLHVDDVPGSALQHVPGCHRTDGA